MAKQLVASMDTPYEPEAHKDEYQQRLRELIENKIAGKEIVAAKNESSGNVIDLMEALKASIDASKKNAPKKRTRKPKGA